MGYGVKKGKNTEKKKKPGNRDWWRGIAWETGKGETVREPERDHV